VGADRDNDQLSSKRPTRDAEPRLSSSTDLLDLVRSAEEGAILGDKRRREPEPEHPRVDEVVDIDDEATDAPPSLPASAPSSIRPAPREARPVPPGEAKAASLPPVVSILLTLALAVATLALLAR
jgi:hypothetical protein